MESAKEVFDLMDAGIKAQGSDLVSKVKGVILYDIGGKQWTVDLKNGTGSVASGKLGTPDITITVSEEDFLQLAQGKLNPQQAFMRGKLKLKGNMAMAMKLNSVLDAARKAAPPLGGVAAKAPAGAVPPKAPEPSKAAAGGKVLKSQPLFDAIGLAIKSDGASLVKSVNGVIQFNITAGGPEPASSYLLDLKKGPGSFSVNPAPGGPAPDLTITISDDDFVALADGKLNPQSAFMKGKLKVKGNMALAMKLQTVLEAARKAPAAKL